MMQRLRDQSYRFDRGAVAYVAASQTTTITHAAAVKTAVNVEK